MYLTARTALAAGIRANRSRDRERLLKAAERMAASIAKERMPWSDPLVPLILAPIADYHGDASRAAALLSEAVQGFDQMDMRLRAMAARRRLGQSVGSDRGRELIAEADEWMRSQEIKNPALLTRMLAPGWTE